MSTHQSCCCQCPCPRSEPQLPLASTGDPPILAAKSGSFSYEVTVFSLGPGAHKILCAPSKSGVSVSPSPVEFLWSSCDQTPLAFKARFSAGSSSLCHTPRLGSLMCDSRLSLLWENFCGIIIQFVGHPPGRYGI